MARTARKRVLGFVKLQIVGGQANPAPPVGPALGQHGVNIMDFCKQFNSKTQSQAGTLIPVEITVYADRSFTFITKTPPGVLPHQEDAGAGEGLLGAPRATRSPRCRWPRCGRSRRAKMQDLNTEDIVSAMRMIQGTARAMGIEVDGELTA